MTRDRIWFKINPRFQKVETGVQVTSLEFPNLVINRTTSEDAWVDYQEAIQAMVSRARRRHQLDEFLGSVPAVYRRNGIWHYPRHYFISFDVFFGARMHADQVAS